jgi:hypothetical protein
VASSLVGSCRSPSQLARLSSGGCQPTSPLGCCCHCRSLGILPRELGAVVGDDRIGYDEAIDDVSEERYRLLRADVDDRPI